MQLGVVEALYVVLEAQPSIGQFPPVWGQGSFVFLERSSREEVKCFPGPPHGSIRVRMLRPTLGPSTSLMYKEVS
jgi:hypothetical protein